MLVSSSAVCNCAGPWTHKPRGLLFLPVLAEWLLTGIASNKIKFVFTKIFLFRITIRLSGKSFLSVFSTALTHFVTVNSLFHSTLFAPTYLHAFMSMMMSTVRCRQTTYYSVFPRRSRYRTVLYPDYVALAIDADIDTPT